MKRKGYLAFISFLLVSVLMLSSCGLLKLPSIFGIFFGGDETETNDFTYTDTKTSTQTSTNTNTETNTNTDEQDPDILWIESVNIVGKTEEDIRIEVIIDSEQRIDNAKIEITDIYGNSLRQDGYIGVEKGQNRLVIEGILDLETDGVVIGSYQTSICPIKVEVILPYGINDNPETNIKYAYFEKVQTGKILIVYGDDTQLEQFDRAINQIDLSDYDVERCSVSNFPRSLEKMLEYDKIILMNVGFAELAEYSSKAATNIKRYVSELGRSVLVTCGNNTVDSNGEYISTPIDDILPVSFVEHGNRTNAMVLIVDLSASMKEQVSNSGSICNKCDFYYEPDTVPESNVCTNCNQLSTFPAPTRYHIVLESVKKVVRESTFETHDYMGVIVFDQDYHVALEIQEIGDEENREVLCEAMAKEFEKYYYAHYVDKLTGEESDIRINFQEDGTPGTNNKYVDGEDAKYALPENFSEITGGNDRANGDLIKTRGTSYKWPIQEAGAMLARAQQLAGSLEIKQVVFMSDGAPNDKGSGYEGIVERMAKGGTVTSSIAICIDKNNHDAISELEKISVAGKGELFVVKGASELDEAISDIIDGMKASDRTENIQPIRDSLNSTIHEGMNDVEYDMIHGYYASQIKDGAERVIYVDNLRPLYAEWECGLGHVAILTTDLGNEDWTGEMFDDTDGRENLILIRNIFAAQVNNRINSTGLDYEVSRDNENVTILVETYIDLSLRDYTDENGTRFKETINAVIYKFDKNLGVWKEHMPLPKALQIADRKYQINIRTDSIEDVCVVVIKLNKSYRDLGSDNGSYDDYQAINFSTHGDDPLCDTISLLIGK